MRWYETLVIRLYMSKVGQLRSSDNPYPSSLYLSNGRRNHPISMVHCPLCVLRMFPHFNVVCMRLKELTNLGSHEWALRRPLPRSGCELEHSN